MFKRIKDFEEAYYIMEEAFPISELRPYEKIKELYEKEIVEIYGYYEPELKGAMILWLDNKYLMIENFAVDKKARGEGIGSKMLREVCKQFKDKKIVLEVEKPYDEMSRRRIEFYQRNGFVLSQYGYMQPVINESKNEVPLLLMAYQREISELEFEDIKNTIYKLVYCSY